MRQYFANGNLKFLSSLSFLTNLEIVYQASCLLVRAFDNSVILRLSKKYFFHQSSHGLLSCLARLKVLTESVLAVLTNVGQLKSRKTHRIFITWNKLTGFPEFCSLKYIISQCYLYPLFVIGYSQLVGPMQYLVFIVFPDLLKQAGNGISWRHN